MLKHRWWYFYFLDLMIYHLSGLTLRVSTASFQYLFPQSILLLSFYFYHFSFPSNIQIPTPDAFIVEWTLWSSTWFVEWCKNIWNSKFIDFKSLRFVAQKPYKNSLFIYKNLSQIIKKSESWERQTKKRQICSSFYCYWPSALNPCSRNIIGNARFSRATGQNKFRGWARKELRFTLLILALSLCCPPESLWSTSKWITFISNTSERVAVAKSIWSKI